ncbi:AzlC family ABC transporter permease [Salinisphaera orenii]|uniref:AzlC family ABC transporter permease n=1 Tax=Salinisphaera orenii TaxID=856731 RepID=UPI003A4C61A2
MAGVRVVSPVLVGILPFALIVGVSMAQAGFSIAAAGVMSLLVFAGASQLAAVSLLSAGAPVAVVVLTVVIINLRFVMYSASLSLYLHRLSAPVRAMVAYLLNDQDYMLSLYAFEQRSNTRSRLAFFMGTALPLWLGWQSATLVGASLGAGVPSAWRLDFAVSLTFLAMLVPAVRDRAGLSAAVVGGGVAVALAGLPSNLGLIIGAAAGVLVGIAVRRVTGVRIAR